jgi:hypothetical protein
MTVQVCAREALVQASFGTLGTIGSLSVIILRSLRHKSCKDHAKSFSWDDELNAQTRLKLAALFRALMQHFVVPPPLRSELITAAGWTGDFIVDYPGMS